MALNAVSCSLLYQTVGVKFQKAKLTQEETQD